MVIVNEVTIPLSAVATADGEKSNVYSLRSN